jgi:hypothetical protein
VSQRSYGNRSVIGRHATELVSRDQRGARAQVRGAQCGDDPSRSSANDDDVDRVPFIHGPYLKSRAVRLKLFPADGSLATS